MRAHERIRQLLPADGWRVLYAGEDEHGAVDLWAEPLIAWALITDPDADSDEDADEIHPVGDTGLGYVSVLDHDDYVAVLAPGVDIETHRGEAVSYIAARKARWAAKAARQAKLKEAS